MKNLLIVVDYQRDFVDGSLGFPGAAALEAGICQRIEAYRERGDDVVFTFDTHDRDYLTTREGEHLPVPHCLEGAEGWRLYGRVAELCGPDSPIFCKHTFGSLQLAQFIQGRKYRTIELVGVVTNMCVLSNAVLAMAADPEAEILIDANLVASNDPVLHRQALDVMAGLQMRVTGG